MIINHTSPLHFLHLHRQVIETLAQGVEQRLAIVSLGSDNETVRSISFHCDDITTIVLRVTAHKHFHQHTLRNIKSTLVSRRAKTLAKVIDECLYAIECRGIACEHILVCTGILLARVVAVVPGTPAVLAQFIAVMQCQVVVLASSLAVDENTVFIIAIVMLPIQFPRRILVTFVA